LPFVDDSKDVSNQYISDGITEGVIDKLSELPELRIMSHNSVFRFKGKDAGAQAAGRDLKVQAVLTGRITRRADALTINAELVNVSDGSRIWGRQFRYPVSDFSRALELGNESKRAGSANEQKQEQRSEVMHGSIL